MGIRGSTCIDYIACMTSTVSTYVEYNAARSLSQAFDMAL